MPVFAYRCPECAVEYEAARPVARRDESDCACCGARAARVFRPDWISIQTPAHLKHTRGFFQPLSTPEHTADYLEGKVLDDHLNKLYAADAAAKKNSIPFEERFWKANPDLNPNAPLTKADQAELKAALGAVARTAGGGGVTHGG